MVSQILKIHGEMKQKPSKNMLYKNADLVNFNIGGVWLAIESLVHVHICVRLDYG